MSAQPPARFFTINQVLAKYDGHLEGADPVRLAAIQPSQSMTDAAVGPLSPQSTMSDEPFGLRAFRAPEGLLWIKWRKAEADIKADLETLQECRDNFEQCPATAARFALIIDEIKARSGRARIEAVNRLINSSVRYVSDLAQHGVLDRWTAPPATLAGGQGDCEDYAIAKYVALREAGVEADDLRFLVVRDRLAGGHEVLGVRHDGRWLILDNRHLALDDSSALPHFTPLFALSHPGVQLFAAPYANRAKRPATPRPPQGRTTGRRRRWISRRETRAPARGVRPLSCSEPHQAQRLLSLTLRRSVAAPASLYPKRSPL